MNCEKEISLLRAKLSKTYEKRRRENYLRDAPHTPFLFDGLFLSAHQLRFIKKLNAFDERAYAKYLRKAPTEIRRWAIDTHKVPRNALKAVNAYGLQLDIQQYTGMKLPKFIASLYPDKTKPARIDNKT